MSTDAERLSALARRKRLSALQRQRATIVSGDGSVTMGEQPATSYADPFAPADPETGEITDIKTESAETACRLLDRVWADVAADYPIGPLNSLKIAQKIVNAVLTGAVAEHMEFLAEPLKPRQTRMDGL